MPATLDSEKEEERMDKRDGERREEARAVGIALFAYPGCKDAGTWGEEKKWWLHEPSP